MRETAEQGLFELGVIEISEKGGEGVVGRDDQPAMARSHSPALSLADEAPLIGPDLEVVMEELDGLLVDVLHDDNGLGLITVPPFVVELRVVARSAKDLPGKVTLAHAWLAVDPDAATVRLVDELDVAAVDLLEIPQVLDLNFGGNLTEPALNGQFKPVLPVLSLASTGTSGRTVAVLPRPRVPGVLLGAVLDGGLPRLDLLKVSKGEVLLDRGEGARVGPLDSELPMEGARRPLVPAAQLGTWA